MVSSFPSTALAVDGPSERTVEAFAASGATVFAEIGVYEGDTTLRIAEQLGGRGQLHLFDFEDRLDHVIGRLEAAGHRNAIAHPNSRKIMDSYNWSLMRLLQERRDPVFEYVYLDGVHTWGVDALAFLLIDRLLKPGGLIEFDDYGWTIERSPSMNPLAFPAAERLYTREQIEVPQVELVVDLLVRGDPRYEEVAENRLFRKRECSTPVS
jgi:predicted O-methyltransferase YrrM